MEKDRVTGETKVLSSTTLLPQNHCLQGVKVYEDELKGTAQPASPAGIRSKGQGTRERPPEHPGGRRGQEGPGPPLAVLASSVRRLLTAPRRPQSRVPASLAWDPSRRRGADGPGGPALLCTSSPRAAGERRRESAVCKTGGRGTAVLAARTGHRARARYWGLWLPSRPWAPPTDRLSGETALHRRPVPFNPLPVAAAMLGCAGLHPNSRLPQPPLHRDPQRRGRAEEPPRQRSAQGSRVSVPAEPALVVVRQSIDWLWRLLH